MTSDDRTTDRGTFASATRLQPLDALRYAAVVPDGWQQGRGAFGGLVLGLLARALESAEQAAADAETPGKPALRRLRTLSGDICGPVLPGPAELVVRVLRRGNNQSNLAAELVQGGEVLATATAVLSAPRKVSAASIQPAPPASRPWNDTPPLALAPPIGPVFAAHYEYRSTGALPFTGAREATTSGFIRETVPPATLDGPTMIGRLDAWWPAFFSVVDEPRMTVTISFVAQLLVDPATIDPSKPLAYRARVEALEEGFLVELRELWDGDRVVALNQQTFAILR